MNFRLASLKDMGLLVDLRKRLLVEEGQNLSANIDETLKTFFENQLSSNQFVQLLAEDKGTIMATGAIQFMQFPPSYLNPTGMRGYILNMYTYADYRNKGIARQLLHQLLTEARRREVNHIFLIASEMGKPVYKKIGFTENDVYMEYFLSKGNS